MMIMRYAMVMLLVSWLRCSLASASASPAAMCHPSDEPNPPLLYALLLRNHYQCPLSFYPNPPFLVSGDVLEKALTSKERNGYTSVLIYASWCPFSKDAYLTFEELSSMYPQIEHLAVEQSSTMPSLFSRYGIHSLPAILMVNQTSRMRFHGSKDLESFINFYKQTTGLDPVQYITVDQSGSLGTGGDSIIQSLIGASMDEIWTREPYLLLSVLFLFLRVVIYLFPRVLYRFKTIWASYRLHLNLEIFGETSQILGRIFHVIDVKRVWTKLKLCKSRNLHRGARNARVWASSLTSVSLGETSTTRFSS